MFNLFPSDETRALRLHREAVVIDSLGGYEELTDSMQTRIAEMISQGKSLEAVMDEMTRMDFETPLELGPAWQEGLRTSGVSAISLTLGVFGKELFGYEAAVKDLAAWNYKFDIVPDLVKVRRAGDIVQAKKEGKLGIIFNFQNTTHFGADLDKIDLFYQMGIRQVQMTYNDLNLVGAGCTERVDCGLSRFGLKVVERLNKLGILIDLSHTGYRTTLDVIEASATPPAFTHTVCKTVRPHDRGKTDDQLEALAKKGGYVGFVLVPPFITADPEPSVEHFLDHVDYAVKIVGADKVGIGTDHLEMYKPLADLQNRELLARLGFEAKHAVDFNLRTLGYRSWRDFPNLARGLVAHGYSDTQVKGILGENYLHIFRQAVG